MLKILKRVGKTFINKNMENKQKCGLCKASIILGIIAIVIALLPLLSGWLLFVTIFNYLVVPAGVICGVIAVIKSQYKVKAIIGIALCVLAFFLPNMLAEAYVESAAESVSNAVGALDSMGAFENL